MAFRDFVLDAVDYENLINLASFFSQSINNYDRNLIFSKIERESRI